jgi:hypothetical protein
MPGWTPAMLDALREQVASGVLEVTMADGRRVKYTSVDEGLRAIAAIQADLIDRGSIEAARDRSVSYTVFER